MSEAAALIALAAILAAAVARPAWAPDWVVAIGASLLLFAGGGLSGHEGRHTLASLGPTVGVLAGLLVPGGFWRRRCGSRPRSRCGWLFGSLDESGCLDRGEHVGGLCRPGPGRAARRCRGDAHTCSADRRGGAGGRGRAVGAPPGAASRAGGARAGG